MQNTPNTKTRLFILITLWLTSLLLSGCNFGSTDEKNTFQKWNSSQALEAFKSLGFNIEDVRPVKANDCLAVSMNYAEGVYFSLLTNDGNKHAGCLFGFEYEKDFEDARSTLVANVDRMIGTYAPYPEDNLFLFLPESLNKHEQLILANAMAAMGENESSSDESFKKWNSKQAVTAFEKAGIKFESSRPVNSDDCGAIPVRAVEGTFLIFPQESPRLRYDVCIYSFEDEKSLTDAYRLAYVSNTGYLPNEKDNILIITSIGLTDRRKVFEVALDNME